MQILHGYTLNFFLIKKFLTALHGMWDLSSLTKDPTCVPLQWKCRVLTTGLPGKSQHGIHLYSEFCLAFLSPLGTAGRLKAATGECTKCISCPDDLSSIISWLHYQESPWVRGRRGNVFQRRNREVKQFTPGHMATKPAQNLKASGSLGPDSWERIPEPWCSVCRGQVGLGGGLGLTSDTWMC